MRRSIPINIIVQINKTITRHIKHADYLKSAPKAFSIPYPRRTAWLQQSAIWATRHIQSTINKRILWTKSTRLLVRWPSVGPLPWHAFSNSINWWIHNIRPIQTVPHTCPNTEGNPNVQGCEDRRNTHNIHPKYLKGTNNQHGAAWSIIITIRKNIWQCRPMIDIMY